jgi:hypothetical protein
MTSMQWIGLIVGAMVLLSRLPGVIWPGPWVRQVRALVARPAAVRTLGVVLLVLAAVVVVLLPHTLSFFQTVMLVVAVVCVGGGIVTLFFPDAYRALTDRVLSAMPLPVVRVAAGLGSALGVWIIYLSLTLE